MAGVVCVAWTLTVADLAIDAVAPGGAAAVLVVVLVSAVLVSVWVTVRPGAVVVETAVLEPVAVESTSLACWAALEATVLTAPDPQPPSTTAVPSERDQDERQASGGPDHRDPSCGERHAGAMGLARVSARSCTTIGVTTLRDQAGHLNRMMWVQATALTIAGWERCSPCL